MIVFFDCETTGKANFRLAFDHPSQPHIVQLGALLTEDDGTERGVLDVIIKPDGWTIPLEASKVHGITDEIAERCGIPLASAMSVFSNMLRKASVVVAHNIDFDLLITSAAFHRLGKPFPEAISKFCTMKATTPLCKLPGNYGDFKWPKLTEAHFHFFGTRVEGAHDAITDVRACKRIFFELEKLKANEASNAVSQ